MPIQSRSSLAALMTVSLAVAAPLVFTQIAPVWAQGGSSGGGSGGSAGSGATGSGGTSGTGSSITDRSGSGAMGSGTTGGASDRGGSATDRTMSDTPRPGMDPRRPGMSDTRPGMSRDATGRDTTGSSMSGSSGNEATRGATGATRADDGSLVGTAKLNAALSALEGTSATGGRRSGVSARLVLMEEYETAMRNALAIQDPMQRSAAVSEARDRLQRAADRQVSPEVIARVDSILGLPATATR